jgi:hypothetical protein
MTDAPERTLSERIQDRQTTFRDAGDVEDLRGYIVDDSHRSCATSPHWNRSGGIYWNGSG